MIDRKGWMVDFGIEGLEITERIGTGGSASVFAATQTATGRQVAVKILRASLIDERSTRQFGREVEAYKRLSLHPRIVAVLESGTTDRGEPYLVMPRLVESLQDLITRSGSLPWAEACAFTISAGRAIAYAHAQGVLHRDIKPANLLLDDDGDVYVADFGIAKLLDATHSASTYMALTPAYAPPERFSRVSDDPRSDTYSLAATCFAMIAGQPPYSTAGASAEQAMRAVLDDPVPSARQFGAPAAVSEVLSVAMAKNPADRQPTLMHFIEDLRAAMSPPPLASRLKSDHGEPRVAARARDPQPPTASSPRARSSLKLFILVIFILVGWNLASETADRIDVPDLFGKPPRGSVATATPAPRAAEGVVSRPTVAVDAGSIPGTQTPTKSPVPSEPAAVSPTPTPQVPDRLILTADSVGGVPLTAEFDEIVDRVNETLGATPQTNPSGTGPGRERLVWGDSPDFAWDTGAFELEREGRKLPYWTANTTNDQVLIPELGAYLGDLRFEKGPSTDPIVTFGFESPSSLAWPGSRYRLLFFAPPTKHISDLRPTSVWVSVRPEPATRPARIGFRTSSRRGTPVYGLPDMLGFGDGDPIYVTEPDSPLGIVSTSDYANTTWHLTDPADPDIVMGWVKEADLAPE